MVPDDELAERRRQRKARLESPAENRFSTLSEHVATGRSINIHTHVPDEHVHGYLLALSRELALFHAFSDFEPDGYSLIPVGEIADLVCGENERRWDQIVASEGLLEGLKLDPSSIDLTSWGTAVASVARKYRHVIVETGGDTFHLGRVLGHDDHDLRLHDVDFLGHWDGTATLIKLDDLARVQLDTRYLRRFSKYCEPEPAVEERGP